MFLKRLEDNEVIYDWYENGWCDSSSNTQNLIMKAIAYVTFKEKLKFKAVVSKLIDENAPVKVTIVLYLLNMTTDLLFKILILVTQVSLILPIR